MQQQGVPLERQTHESHASLPLPHPPDPTPPHAHPCLFTPSLSRSHHDQLHCVRHAPAGWCRRHPGADWCVALGWEGLGPGRSASSFIGRAAHSSFAPHVPCSALPSSPSRPRMLTGPARPPPPAGMNLYAAAVLIPVGVIMYTAHGGLKVGFNDLGQAAGSSSGQGAGASHRASSLPAAVPPPPRPHACPPLSSLPSHPPAPFPTRRQLSCPPTSTPSLSSSRSACSLLRFTPSPRPAWAPPPSCGSTSWLSRSAAAPTRG
mgnify:CR=1 FL=1